MEHDLIDEDGRRRMSLRDLRDHLGQRVDAAHFRGEVTVITKNGQPRAALISHDQYRRLAPQIDEETA